MAVARAGAASCSLGTNSPTVLSVQTERIAGYAVIGAIGIFLVLLASGSSVGTSVMLALIACVPVGAILLAIRMLVDDGVDSWKDLQATSTRTIRRQREESAAKFERLRSLYPEEASTGAVDGAQAARTALVEEPTPFFEAIKVAEAELGAATERHPHGVQIHREDVETYRIAFWRAFLTTGKEIGRIAP